MTKEDKIKVLAELDGFACPIHGCGIKDGQSILLPLYLTSYDAIIPLVKKVWESGMLDSQKFYQALPSYYPHILTFIQHISPEQLCDALIKGVGQWKE